MLRVIRQSNKRTDKSHCWISSVNNLIDFSFSALCDKSVLADKIIMARINSSGFLCISHSLDLLPVRESRMRKACKALQKSTDWTDILFIRGEILSPTTTYDSNWNFMVPGTHWDIRIYGVGRWMAKIHDHAMRGEREGGWRWGQRQYGRGGKKRKATMGEEKRRDTLAQRNDGLWGRAAVETTNATIQMGDWPVTHISRWWGVKMGSRVCINVRTYVLRRQSERKRMLGERSSVQRRRESTGSRITATIKGQRRQEIQAIKELRACVWQEWPPPVLHEREKRGEEERRKGRKE